MKDMEYQQPKQVVKRKDIAKQYVTTKSIKLSTVPKNLDSQDGKSSFRENDSRQDLKHLIRLAANSVSGINSNPEDNSLSNE